jgi:hypothetical protein
MLKRLSVFGLFLLWAAQAPAAILLALDGTPKANGSGGFDWTYDARLQPSSLMTLGDLFTVYDFNGLTGVTNASFQTDPGLTGVHDFQVTRQPTGIDPVTGNLTPQDSPNISNVTVTLFAGENIVPLGGVTKLGKLTLTSTVGEDTSKFINYTGQDVQQGQLTPGSNLGSTLGPIPEPATVGFLGLGLAAIAALSYRRRKSSLKF